MAQIDIGYSLVGALFSAGQGAGTGRANIRDPMISDLDYYVGNGVAAGFGVLLQMGCTHWALKGIGNGTYNGSMAMIGYKLGQRFIP